MFDVITARDFYIMVIEDFDDFMEEPHSARRALHCAISAYHLHEWVWSDWLKNDAAVRKRLGIKKSKDDFVAWLLGSSAWFHYVQAMANGTKHLGRTHDFATIKVMPPASFDQLDADREYGAWNGPVQYVSGSLPVGPKGKGYLILDLGEDIAPQSRWMPVAHILEAVLRFWRDFFRYYRLDENVPASRHHLD
jgi:hypothetical protein